MPLDCIDWSKLDRIWKNTWQALDATKFAKFDSVYHTKIPYEQKKPFHSIKPGSTVSNYNPIPLSNSPFYEIWICIVWGWS